MHNETRDVKRVRTALKPNTDEVPKFVLRFIAFDTRLHYIISEYWRTGRRRGGNNQNFVPPPVEADTNEDDWGVFSKVERVYICIFNQSLSLFLSLSLTHSLVLSSVKSRVTFSTTITLKECMQNLSVDFEPFTFVILCSAAAIDALTR